MTVNSFEINQADLTQTRWVDEAEPAPADGQIVTRLDRVSFTANNITYAATGKELRYWDFFPASEDGFGRIPVWGFAEVVASAHPQIEKGERLYGYWPMSTHLLMTPEKVSAPWFFDATAHRRELPAVYNQYYRCASDPSWTADTEDQQALYRPLFVTSFMIDDFLADNSFFGAQTVIISSASSKTSFGTAFLQQQRGQSKTVGLTSVGNLDFVKSLGCYDQVLTYDEVDQLEQEASVYVDIAGNSGLRYQVHAHLGDSLKFSSAVGYSHLGTLEHGQDLPGPAPQFFFAPAQVQKREKDWADSGGVAAHYAEAWISFMPKMLAWTPIVSHQGDAAIGELYQKMLAGQVSPTEGHILRW